MSSETHERLNEVLRSGIVQATLLRASLEDERLALESRDSDALSRAIQTKASHLEKLAELERERSALLESAGLTDVTSASSGDEDALMDRWNEYRAIAAECDTLNLGNGAIIRLRQQQVADGLALLRGADANADTYGPAGTNATGGRELTEA